jgi:hypothetical protein
MLRHCVAASRVISYLLSCRQLDLVCFSSAMPHICINISISALLTRTRGFGACCCCRRRRRRRYLVSFHVALVKPDRGLVLASQRASRLCSTHSPSLPLPNEQRPPRAQDPPTKLSRQHNITHKANNLAMPPRHAPTTLAPRLPPTMSPTTPHHQNLPLVKLLCQPQPPPCLPSSQTTTSSTNGHSTPQLHKRDFNDMTRHALPAPLDHKKPVLEFSHIASTLTSTAPLFTKALFHLLAIGSVPLRPPDNTSCIVLLCEFHTTSLKRSLLTAIDAFRLTQTPRATLALHTTSFFDVPPLTRSLSVDTALLDAIAL